MYEHTAIADLAAALFSVWPHRVEYIEFRTRRGGAWQEAAGDARFRDLLGGQMCLVMDGTEVHANNGAAVQQYETTFMEREAVMLKPSGPW